MIERHHDEAQKSGARIVHCCGFDSVPFDIGVHVLWQRHRIARARGFCARLRGGFGGGGVASALQLFEDRGELRQLANPYALVPGRRGADARDQRFVRFDRDEGFTAPFVMAAVNTRVVRRSAALLGYGESFRYQESRSTGRGALGLARASAITAGLGAVAVLGSIGPLRRAARRFLPAPGEGPSAEERARGSFEIVIHGEDPDVSLEIRGGDPANGETAKMLAESAMCLAKDELSTPYGVLTPASAMGEALANRLVRAGITMREGTRGAPRDRSR